MENPSISILLSSKSTTSAQPTTACQNSQSLHRLNFSTAEIRSIGHQESIVCDAVLKNGIRMQLNIREYHRTCHSQLGSERRRYSGRFRG